jgi:gamma-tubulin complex component 2
MQYCVTFTTQAEKYSSLLTVLEEEQAVDRFGIPKAGLVDTSLVLFENFNRSLAKIEESFLKYMKLLINTLNLHSGQETVQFLCLVVRLDYNQFYSNAPMTARDDRASSRQR